MLLTHAVLMLGLFQYSLAIAASPDDLAIRFVLKDVEEASNQRDSARILSHATKDIVMVSKNGSIVSGRVALASYLDTMFGIAPALKGLHSRVFMSEPSIMYDHAAIASGTSEDEYDFADGMKLKITTVWSATLVQVNGEWKIARVHFSFNLFDNPILAGAKILVYVALAAGLIAGVASGAAWSGYVGHRRHVS